MADWTLAGFMPKPKFNYIDDPNAQGFGHLYYQSNPPDGPWVDLGYIRGEDGAEGPEGAPGQDTPIPQWNYISDPAASDFGHLYVQRHPPDGLWIDLGRIRGEDGDDGDYYLPYAETNEDGSVTIYRQLYAYQNGGYVAEGDPETMVTLPVVNGVDGQDGRSPVFALGASLALIDLQIGIDNPGHLFWKYADEGNEAWRDLGNIQGHDGADGKDPVFATGASLATIGVEIGAANPDNLFWKYSVEPHSEWRDLGLVVRGQEGPPGDYFQISSTNPDGDLSVAFFHAQRHNSQNEALTDSYQIGGVIAPKPEFNLIQIPSAEDYGHLYWRPEGSTSEDDWVDLGYIIGPRGEQGEEGLPGPAGSVAGYPDIGEWQAWSFIAWMITDAFAQFLKDAEGPLATFWGAAFFALDMLPGAFSISGQLEEIFNLPGASRDAMSDSDLILEAAEDLYCQLVHHTDLLDADFDVIYRHFLNLGNWPGSSWRIKRGNFEYKEALLALIGEEMNHRPNMARRAISIAYERYKTATYRPDFSGSSCTPDYEDWNHVFDFVSYTQEGDIAGKQGWVGGGTGEGTGVFYVGHVPPTDYPGGGWGLPGSNGSLSIVYHFDHWVDFKRIEAIVDFKGAHALAKNELFIGNAVVDSHKRILLYDAQEQGPKGGSKIIVSSIRADANTRIRRVSVAGYGTPPTFPARGDDE